MHTHMHTNTHTNTLSHSRSVHVCMCVYIKKYSFVCFRNPLGFDDRPVYPSYYKWKPMNYTVSVALPLYISALPPSLLLATICTRCQTAKDPDQQQLQASGLTPGQLVGATASGQRSGGLGGPSSRRGNVCVWVGYRCVCVSSCS